MSPKKIRSISISTQIKETISCNFHKIYSKKQKSKSNSFILGGGVGAGWGGERPILFSYMCCLIIFTLQNRIEQKQKTVLIRKIR